MNKANVTDALFMMTNVQVKPNCARARDRERYFNGKRLA